MPQKKTPRSAVMNTKEAAFYVGLAKSTLEKMRLYSKDGPPFISINSAVRYRIEDLDAWLAQRVFRDITERDRVHGRRRRPCRPHPRS